MKAKKNNNKYTSQQKQSKIASVHSNKKFAIIGIIFFVFAIIGLVWTIIFSSGLISDAINKTSLKTKLEKEVYPLVAVDIPAFEEVSLLDDKAAISAGVWQLIMNAPDIDKYIIDDFDTMAIPAVDLEVYIKQLFGSEIEIEHQQVPDTQFYISYVEDEQTYYLSSSFQSASYNPIITELVEENNAIIATIGYISSSPLWQFQDSKQDNNITKTMTYTLVEKDGNYNIKSVSIKTLDMVQSQEEEKNLTSDTTSSEMTSDEDDNSTVSDDTISDGTDDNSPSEETQSDVTSSEDITSSDITSSEETTNTQE